MNNNCDANKKIGDKISEGTYGKVYVVDGKNNEKTAIKVYKGDEVLEFEFLVEIDVLFKVIKDKVINKNFPEHPWIPISGIDKGAWKIGKTRLSN